MKEFIYQYKNKKYLVRTNGLITNVWRISNIEKENNENGVITGVKGWQGKFSKTRLNKLIEKWEVKEV